jgi:hypothetical protein
MAKEDKKAGRILIAGFVLVLAALIVWFAVDLGGVMPGDTGAPPPEETSGGSLGPEGQQ